MKIDTSAIQSAVEFNVSLLGLPEPEIEYLPPEQFITATIRAAASRTGKSIAVNTGYDISELDAWLFISHELRHVWQIRKGILRPDYTDRSATAFADYNLQPEEIDAHAWAALVTTNRFNVRPTYEVLFGEACNQKITERMTEIINHHLY